LKTLLKNCPLNSSLWSFSQKGLSRRYKILKDLTFKQINSTIQYHDFSLRDWFYFKKGRNDGNKSLFRTIWLYNKSILFGACNICNLMISCDINFPQKNYLNYWGKLISTQWSVCFIHYTPSIMDHFAQENLWFIIYSFIRLFSIWFTCSLVFWTWFFLL
jgi:hypothetical protein